MSNELRGYVFSLPEPPTLDELKAHFRAQGKEIVVIPISQDEIRFCEEMGIGCHTDRLGRTVALPTAELENR